MSDEQAMSIKEKETPGRRMLWQSGVLILFAVIVGLLVNLVRPDGLALMAAPDPAVSGGKGSDAKLIVPLEQARHLFFANEAVFLDARSRRLYEKGHVAGARSLPAETAEQSAFEVLADMSQDAVLITYCDGKNCVQGKKLAVFLLGMGFRNVRVLDNGWTRWTKKGLPTEKGSNAS
jgi:rhodanese-related sulfurtransferase